MYPVYQSMNSSYPHHQMQSIPHHQHHPGYYYQSWPPHPAYGYLAPQPPYTPVAPVIYPGVYPAPPASYPVCYGCPPPYTMVEAPDYARPLGNMSGNHGHCCGCPNHQHKRDGNVKIEEESPDETLTNSSPVAWVPRGSMMNAASDDSGKPARKDFTHSGGTEANQRPIPSSEQKALLNRWIPLIMDNTGEDDSARRQDNQGGNKRNFMNGWLPLIMDDSGFEKQGVDSARKHGSQDGDGRNFANGWWPWMVNNPGVAKLACDSLRKQENQDADKEKFANGWLPLIIDNSGSAKRGGGDSTGKKEHQDEDKRRMSFPLIWVPYNLDDPKEKRDSGKLRAAEEGTKEKPKVMILGSEDKDNIPPEVNEAKNVPAKTVESAEQGNLPKKNEVKMESPSGGSEDVKSHQGSAKSKPSSPSKSQKLPPICLRVDPVHKRKNGKCSSRSPSPPKDKEKLQQPVRSDAKEAVERDAALENSTQESCRDAEQRERKVKTIEVSEGLTEKDENVVAVEKRTSKADEGLSPSDQSAALDMDGKFVKIDPSDIAKNARMLSEDEAATIIQSAYRGYEVRRWEPLKKLKQIADVRDQVVKLDKQIASDMQIDDKWRISIEETIMNLLLKLDTIQGLHPSIRDVRKSVARELVSLQEKIDCLTCMKSETVQEQNSGDKFDQDGGELKPSTAHEVHSEVNKDVAPAGLDVNDRENDASSELIGTESLGTPSTITGCDLGNEATTTTDTTETESKSENEVMDLVFGDDQGHSVGCSLQQVWHNDVDSGASSVEPVAHSLRISTVSESENEAWNGSKVAELSECGGNESADELAVASPLELVAAFQGANDADLDGTRLSWENEATTKTENLAMEVSLHHDSSQVGNVEITSLATDEVSDLKEVSESLKGHSSVNLHGDSHLLQFEEGNDNSQQCETVMEDVTKGKDLTHEEATEGFGDGDENPIRAACVQSNDDVSMNVNEKGTYGEDLNVNQQLETEDCLELGVGLARPEDIHDKVENCTASDPGSQEVPIEDAPEEHASLTSRPGDDPEVHNEELREMEAEALVSSSEAQMESPLIDVKSNDELDATDSTLVVNNGCTLEKDQNSSELDAEDVVETSLQDIKDAKKGEVLPPLPTARQCTFGDDGSGLAGVDKKLIEENERLREAMQKLIEAGNEQLAAISSLSGRVKDLEKKLWRKNKLRMRGPHGPSRYTSRKSCLKPSNGCLNEKLAPMAM
ncbi:OLC1v1038470C1 [Oldenlandia corymbosa var. corymbosa]|uniref:OLC1v1038470C1 n=1 Tax=Oldenlandia corymbosa var. corymbosa TaxID=529605 RepID=A0AAV1D301_OLDCO|nr:OLC1v1038470C1 [Oldenlandia corymbosa var. corymbosa]